MAEQTGDGPLGKLTEPQTREEALSRADDWANGALSHWNTMLEAAGEDPQARANAQIFCQVADSIEAQRYTTLAAMLPTAQEMEIREGLPQGPGPDYVELHGMDRGEQHPEMTPSQVELLDQLAESLARLCTRGTLAGANMQDVDAARRALDAYTREVGRENVPAAVAWAIGNLVP